MNIELIARQALNIIKGKWTLPESGFLAGGSLANTIWEIVSNNKAIINDLDIFHFDGIQQKFDRKDKNSLFNYHKTETRYFEDYTGLCFTNKTKEFYSIVEAQRDGIYNHIKYKSNTDDPSLIIRSFDINATGVGYNISDDKIYWTPEFEDFLKTGQLKVCNLVTPCHTAVRIAKKSKELNARLDDFELKLLQYSLSRGFSDKLKWRFKEKYLKMYEDYQHILKPFFNIKRDLSTEMYVLENFSEQVQLYYLEPNIQVDKVPSWYGHTDKIFHDTNLSNIYNTHDFIFYMRNIWLNEKLVQLWTKLSHFFVNENYVDAEFSEYDIELLHRFSIYAPNSIENLKGMKLSEQITVIKKFLDKFKEDPFIAISILESVKVDKDIVLDDDTALILELSVRKKIINDTKGKVGRILEVESKTTNDNNINF